MAPGDETCTAIAKHNNMKLEDLKQLNFDFNLNCSNKDDKVPENWTVCTKAASPPGASVHTCMCKCKPYAFVCFWLSHNSGMGSEAGAWVNLG